MMTTAGSCTEFARDIKQFVSRCAERLEQNILVEGQLPPVVRGQRLAQSHRDKRPHMGGSSAENGSHYAAFLALLREGDAALYPTDLGKRVLASVKPFLGQPLVPFAHRAVLQTLAVYGPLEQNLLWHTLDADTQAACLRETFSVASYYDETQQRMRTLPDNYLWVTSENARLISQLLPDDEAARAAGESTFKQLVKKLRENPWFDDNPPFMVVDQYAWETVAAAVSLGKHYASNEERKFLLELAAQYRSTLYKLARPDGYAFCWGRSQGVISYGTTSYCLLGFGEALFEHGLIPLEAFANDLALAQRSFQTLKQDWFDDDGLTTMHRYGRETFSYRRSHRLVGSTFGMLVKFLHTAEQLTALAQKVDVGLPERISLPGTADDLVDFGAPEGSNRRYGLWIGKNDHWHVALPVVGNPDKFDPKVTTSYLPAPIVPFVLDVPTQHSAPYGTEYLELEDGRVYAAAGGCDELTKVEGGVRLVWHRFLDIESLEYGADLGTLQIDCRLEGTKLTISHHFETARTDILSRYSMLGVALKDAHKHSPTQYVFSDAHRSLSLGCRGNITQMNVENVTDLPAGKSFLTALPWAVSLFLPVISSSFSVELTLGERAV